MDAKGQSEPLAERLIITGGPGCGKTTRAMGLHLARSGGDLFQADYFQNAPWAGQPALTAAYFRQLGPWIGEGVTFIRALRHWLALNDGKPCDQILLLWEPRKALSPGQARMLQSLRTMWAGIVAEIKARGVTCLNG